MNIDRFGVQILSEDDLCDYYLNEPERQIKKAIVDKQINFSSNLELNNIPVLSIYQTLEKTVDEYDTENQNNWFMPKEYQELDIAKYVLDLCKEDYELQRAGEELIKFQERDLFPLLRYCKYLVDIMRKNNIVWGVGRGSSTASYVLYLIGIHRINSLHYDLSIDEFLK
jgi:DNA polymerase III alpha subunit